MRVIMKAFADGGFVGPVGCADGEDSARRPIDNHDAFWACTFACGWVKHEYIGAVAVDEPLLAWVERGWVVGVEEPLSGLAAVEFGCVLSEKAIDYSVGWVWGRGLLAEGGVELLNWQVLGRWVGNQRQEGLFVSLAQGGLSAARARLDA